MSASCLISHLTVSDLNTNAAVYLCFLIIYGRHHFNHYSTIPFQRWSEISHCQSNLIHPWPSVTVHSTATAETEMCLRFSLKKGEDVVRIGAETLLFVQYLWAGFTAFCLEQYLEFFFLLHTLQWHPRTKDLIREFPIVFDNLDSKRMNKDFTSNACVKGTKRKRLISDTLYSAVTIR